MLATQLQLELLLADRSVDLRAAASIICNDLGATLEIFRRAGEEAGQEGGQANRVEDCLASLGTDVWMEAVCGNALERAAIDNAQLAELTAFWEHGRLLAYACWLVAGRVEGVCQEQAYLVGLLHEASRLPYLLGWPLPLPAAAGVQRLCASASDKAHQPLTGREAIPGFMPGVASKDEASLLACHWQLPEYLQIAIVAPASSRWIDVLDMAHAWLHGGNSILGKTARAICSNT